MEVREHQVWGVALVILMVSIKGSIVFLMLTMYDPDASISQSALEEALLSNIQHGRMSTLSQLRSRYL